MMAEMQEMRRDILPQLRDLERNKISLRSRRALLFEDDEVRDSHRQEQPREKSAKIGGFHDSDRTEADHRKFSKSVAFRNLGESEFSKEFSVHEDGKIYLAVKMYKEGKISIEKTAKELNLSISEAIDVMAEFGIKAPIDFEDYLKGYKLEKIF